MAGVPSLNLRAEAMGGDVPEWATQAFEQLNTWALAVGEAVAAANESVTVRNKVFTSDASGSAYVDLKNPFDRKPDGVVLWRLGRDDNAASSTLFKMTWSMASNSIRLLFVGLDASTKHRFTVNVT